MYEENLRVPPLTSFLVGLICHDESQTPTILVIEKQQFIILAVWSSEKKHNSKGKLSCKIDGRLLQISVF